MEDKDYKENLDKDVSILLKEFIDKNIPNRKLRMYTGRVEDNIDPDKLGRCRVRVFGIFDDKNISTQDLPWAVPEQTFIGSTVGNFIVPPVGTLVRVYFDGDDIYAPCYTTKALNKNQLSTLKDADYPDTMILLESDQGDYVIINRKTLEFEFHHASGSSVKIIDDGSISIDNTGSDKGALVLSIKGDVSLTTDGDVSVEAKKGSIKLGGDAATQPCNNFPVCIITGSPHSIGQQFPGTPGNTTVRP
jgi:hypothetical protein